jgi:hypothetical protein
MTCSGCTVQPVSRPPVTIRVFLKNRPYRCDRPSVTWPNVQFVSWLVMSFMPWFWTHVNCKVLATQNVNRTITECPWYEYLQRANICINVTLRHVRVTIVAVEKQYISHILSLSYPACKCLCLIILCLLPVWLYLTFPHDFINCTIRENVIEHKMRVWFSVHIYVKYFSV